MMEFDKAKSLQELENIDWGEANFDSHLIKECHRLRRVPLKEFSVEDLRIMIGQNISLEYLMPLALDKLQQNPLAEGHFYPGDLLVSVLQAKSDFWARHPNLKTEAKRIVDEAFEIPPIIRIEREAVREAYNSFSVSR